MRDQITKALRTVTAREEVSVEFPENEDFGDYSSNIALQLKGNPKEEAEKLVALLKKDTDLSKIIDKIEIKGPGFINFWLKKDVLVGNLIEIDTEKEKYGASATGRGKTVVIDYSSPNIAKPFGVGHLRSTIIGQALYNMYRFLGYEVVGDNHLGDWGTQFGKLIYMIKKENLSDFDIDKLEQLYIEFHKLAEDPQKVEEMEAGARQWFKKLEEGDSAAKQIWQKCVDVSMEEFNRIYKMLGVKIDFAFGESYYESEMRQMLDDPEIKKHLSEGEGGAKIVDLAEAGIKTPLMFLKSDGATTYATRDLATIAFRVRKWDPDIFIYEVGAEQSLHFKQVFAAAKLLGLVKKDVEFVHTAHGLYLGPNGRKFSTREGKTVRLEDVLNEAIKRAKEIIEKSETGRGLSLKEKDNVAKAVGIGAIKYFDLSHHPQTDIIFDWEKVFVLQGNSAPYLQYTVARTNSVLAKSKRIKEGESGRLQINKEELAVLRSLARFGDIIMTSAKNYSPNLLANYLFDLAQKFNAFYDRHRILDKVGLASVGGSSTFLGPQVPKKSASATRLLPPSRSFRVALTAAVGQVLKNGLTLLGIETPERM